MKTCIKLDNDDDIKEKQNYKEIENLSKTWILDLILCIFFKYCQLKRIRNYTQCCKYDTNKISF